MFLNVSPLPRLPGPAGHRPGQNQGKPKGWQRQSVQGGSD